MGLPGRLVQPGIRSRLISLISPWSDFASRRPSAIGHSDRAVNLLVRRFDVGLRAVGALTPARSGDAPHRKAWQQAQMTAQSGGRLSSMATTTEPSSVLLKPGQILKVPVGGARRINRPVRSRTGSRRPRSCPRWWVSMTLCQRMFSAVGAPAVADAGWRAAPRGPVNTGPAPGQRDHRHQCGQHASWPSGDWCCQPPLEYDDPCKPRDAVSDTDRMPDAAGWPPSPPQQAQAADRPQVTSTRSL